jgi:hypothetical protein
MRFLRAAARVGLVVSSALCAGCGSSSSGSDAVTVSCTIANIGNISGTDACTDYRAWPLSTVMALCALPGAQYSASACTRVDSIGGCSGTFGNLSYTRWYYPRAGASPAPTSADVMEDCASTMPAETFVSP